MPFIAKDASRGLAYNYVGPGDVFLDPGAHISQIGGGANQILVELAGAVDQVLWTGHSNTFTVTRGGYVSTVLYADSGATAGGNAIVNHGHVDGVQLYHSAASQAEMNGKTADLLVNAGTISALPRHVTAVGITFGTVVNTGTIVHPDWQRNPQKLAIDYGVNQMQPQPFAVRGSILDNSGDIFGGVRFREGADALDNTGTIRGAVNLGAGDDVVDNGFGRIAGIVSLGTGLDEYAGGSFGETVDGGSGDDTVALGAGNDVYLAATGDGDDSLDGGLGIDSYDLSALLAGQTFDLRDPAGAAIGFDTISGFENVTGTGFADVLTGTNEANRLLGGAGGDQLNGLEGDDRLFGHANADVLAAAAGNDLLDGGLDADTMRGGAGNDTYVVDHAGDVIIDGPNQGIDTVRSGISYALGTDLERLTLTGADGINGTGNGLANILTGNAAANALNGGAGADTMRGSAGNDSYTVDAAGDVIGENADEGNDIVTSAITYTLGANLERLTLTGAAVNGTGNELGNLMLGNAAGNTLIGLGGNDNLQGGDGNDVLIGGGGGRDMLMGAGGADRYDFNAIAESTNVRTTADMITGGYTAGDQIDVATIDANPLVAGDQAFAFIADAAFTAPGQLRVWRDVSTAIVELNVEGTTGAEMMILWLAGTTLTASDFVL